MSKTKDAIFDRLERQHQNWAQSRSDGVAAKQIESDQQEKALQDLSELSEKLELEF